MNPDTIVQQHDEGLITIGEALNALVCDCGKGLDEMPALLNMPMETILFTLLCERNNLEMSALFPQGKTR